MKKLFVSLLACILCFAMLASCGGGASTTEPTTPTTEPNNQGGEIPQNALALVSNGASDYQIVVAEGEDDDIVDIAYELRWVIKQLTGVELPIVEDSAPMKDTEIVVGNTMRNLYYDPVGENYQNGYATFIRGERIILEGNNEVGLEYALKAFVQDCFGYDINGEEIYFVEPSANLYCQNEYQSVLSFIAMFQNALESTIIYDGTYMQMRLAHVLRDEIIGLMSRSEDDPTPKVEKKENAEGVEGDVVELVIDEEIASGTWRLEVVDNHRVVLYAKDYYGFTSGARKLARYFKNRQQYIDEKSASGDYRDTLRYVEGGSAYAYERQGEHRVMFYNVLWDSFCKEERIELNTTLVAQYMPDVLGLQEMKNNKRGGNNANGKGGLIATLEEIGYVETFDPRVKNFYTKDEKIPGTDASLTTDTEEHVELNGYGTGGGIKVTVNGETFYTYFNCSPLLYNPATTKLIASEYYWYKNQWDKRTGQTHENAADDCASKSATWGVFEDLDTHDRYIVINTHMCTRSDYIRGLQAQELLVLIDELVAEYDCPVLLGGDYNGNRNSTNYKVLEAGGMIDVEKNNLATVYTSKTRGHHTYPAMDEEKGFVQPGPNDNTGLYGSDLSIDHIMITNADEGEMSIGIFGVVIDECSMSGADHFPMVIDFTLDQPHEETTE